MTAHQRPQPAEYTVILQAPDYVDSDRPLTIHHVIAPDTTHAIEYARLDFIGIHCLQRDEYDLIDITSIAVFQGHHDNLSPDS